MGRLCSRSCPTACIPALCLPPPQVNLCLTAAAPEPPIQRLLGALASALADHSVRGAADDPRRLLPCLDARWTDPALGVASPLALGGQLAEASCGVLLLSSSTLDTKRAIGLGQYMAAGEAVLAPGCPELVVPVSWQGLGGACENEPEAVCGGVCATLHARPCSSLRSPGACPCTAAPPAQVGATLWTMVHEQGGCGSWSGAALLLLAPGTAMHSCPPAWQINHCTHCGPQQTWRGRGAQALLQAGCPSRSASLTSSGGRVGGRDGMACGVEAAW